MASFVRELPIFDVAPSLRAPVVSLGVWPTPVTHEPALMASTGSRSDLYIKRDDLSSPIYGGNKVRCLEFLFGEALEAGATHIEATGAFGTNHGVATALHAPRVGLEAGTTIYPQPASHAAASNLKVLASHCEPFVAPHWSALPAAAALRHASLWLRGESVYWMVPGGATPRGALAYVSAGFELALQIEAGELPCPAEIFVGAGSTCTAAGLLCGLVLATRRGLLKRTPKLVAVRVTPWPITSKRRIVDLAFRAGLELAARSDEDWQCRREDLGAHLVVDGSQLGPGYGLATEGGRAALARFRQHAGIELDTTYSAKAAAAFLQRAETSAEPLLFWSTKSTAPLPLSTGPRLSRLSARWLSAAESLQE
ncbi:MAG: 1-aminocyclopropane-1-carboxylate deaminase/D-cysteine desulfhydrase [Polyangiales bacterium]